MALQCLQEAAVATGKGSGPWNVWKNRKFQNLEAFNFFKLIMLVYYYYASYMDGKTEAKKVQIHCLDYIAIKVAELDLNADGLN